MRKSKLRKLSNPIRQVVRRDSQKIISPRIQKIKLLGNSREIRKSAPLVRLPTINQNLSFAPIVKKDPCQQRQNRRRALFRLGKAGKIKVRFAKWTLKSLIRC